MNALIFLNFKLTKIDKNTPILLMLSPINPVSFELHFKWSSCNDSTHDVQRNNNAKVVNGNVVVGLIALQRTGRANHTWPEMRDGFTR